MRFRLRKTVRLGPIFLRFSERGFSSWGVRLGRITHNVTRRRTTFDTPGPGSVQHDHRRGR